MKKIISTLLLFTGIGYSSAFAQCTPDNNLQEPGISPSSLPNGKVGQAYNTVIQFKFPTDTTFQSAKVHIDSARIDSIQFLPKGFAFQTNNPSRTYPGGGNGCALITGNPTQAQVGEHTLKVWVTAYLNFGGLPFPASFSNEVTYTIEGVSSIRFASYRKQSEALELKQNMPNPFSGTTTIQYVLPQSQAVVFKVYDILGNEVFGNEVIGARGENSVTFDRGGLKNGMYFYSIQTGGKTLTKRMMITN